MKKTIRTLIIILVAVTVAFFVVACDKDNNSGTTEAPTSAPSEAPTQNPNETPTEAPTEGNSNNTPDDTVKHTHAYTEKIVSDKYLKSAASCSAQAQYFYSCECGEKGNNTFANGAIDAENHVGGTTVGYEYVNGDAHTVVEYCNGCYTAFEVTEQNHATSCTQCSEKPSAGLYNTVTYYDEEKDEETEYLFISCALTWNELISKDTFEITDGVLSVTEEGKDILAGNLVMEEGAHTFDEWAFSGCVKLTGVVIPNGVSLIEQKAFAGCLNLKHMFIPGSVDRFCHDIFSTVDREYQGKLTNVYIEDIAAWCGMSFGMDSNPLQFAQNLYVNGELVTDLVIPEGITEISDGAFKKCAAIKSVKLPESIKKIGLSAFYGCKELETVTFADNVNISTLGENAFNNCDNMVYNVYDNACYIGSETNPYLILVKAVNQDITSCEIHSDTEFIGYAAFVGCDNLETVSLSSGIKYIEHLAFANGKQRERIRIIFDGTRSEWEAIERHESWFIYNIGYVIVCTNCNITV